MCLIPPVSGQVAQNRTNLSFATWPVPEAMDEAPAACLTLTLIPFYLPFPLICLFDQT